MVKPRIATEKLKPPKPAINKKLSTSWILSSFEKVESVHAEGAGLMGSVSPGEMKRILTEDLLVRGQHFVDLGGGYGNVVLAAAAEGARSSVGYELPDGFFQYAHLFRPATFDLSPSTSLLLPMDILDLRDLNGPECVYSYSTGMPPIVYRKMLSLISKSVTITRVAIFRYDGILAPELRSSNGYLDILNPPENHFPFNLATHRSVHSGGGSKHMFVFTRDQPLKAKEAVEFYANTTIPVLAAISKDAQIRLRGNGAMVTRTQGRGIICSFRSMKTRLPITSKKLSPAVQNTKTPFVLR